MSATRATAVSCERVIVATSPVTDIWLGDDAGDLVQPAVGALRTSRWPGHDVVAGGRGTASSPLHVVKARRATQTALEAGSTGARPRSHLPPAEGRSKVGWHSSEFVVTGCPWGASSRPTRHCSGRGGPRR
jgi:hypothetical protein